MKKLLLILMVLLCYNIVSSQTTAVQQWVQYYNGPDSLNDGSFSIDVQGNIYVSGASQVPPITNPMTYKITTIKYNAAGALKWVAIYDSVSNASYKSIAMKVDASSNVYVTGSVISNQFIQTTDIIVLKYDSMGTLLWSSMYAYPYGKSDEPKAITLDQSGNVYITGFVSDSSIVAYTGISKEFVTIKINSSGVQQWVKYYSDNNKLDDISNDIAVDNSGNVYITGYSYSSISTRDIVTIKYNASGIQQWIKKYDGGGDDFANKLALDNFNNVYVTGSSKYLTSEDFITIKYDNSGLQLWTAFYNGAGNSLDVAKDIAINNNGQIIITGTSIGNGTSDDYTTIKYNPNGSQIWVKTYNGTGNGADIANALSIDNAENIYITGQSTGLTTGIDYTTVKYNTNGAQQWAVRFDGVADSTDIATDIKADSYGNVYVTGYSHNGTDYDFATIKYSEITSIPLTVSITKNDATCNGASNGTAGAMASGGTSPYSYFWSNGQTTQNISGLAANTYFLTVTDSLNNYVFQSIIINEPSIDFITNPAPCSDLFISEYVDGSTHNMALEFYNPSENPIILNRYFVRVFMNGAPTPLITQLSGILAPKQTHVIANPNANSTILTKADQTSHKINFNGDDAIQLIKVLNNVNINIDSIEGHGGNPHDIFDTLQLDILDQIGIPEVTPQNGGWQVGSNGSTKNSTLIRNFGVSSGQSDWGCGQYQWKTMPQDNVTDLGTHQNICTLTSVDVTYSFQNPAYIDSSNGLKYFLYDIFVSASNDSTYLQSTQIILKYDTLAFGSNVSSRMSVTRGVNFDISTYIGPPAQFLFTDFNANRLQIIIGPDPTTTTYNRVHITTTPIVLFHVKMEIKNCNQNSGIEYDSLNGFNISQYTLIPTVPQTGSEHPYNHQFMSNDLKIMLCEMNIISFSPNPITAGTRSVLTINGIGFGSTRGTGIVDFPNANNGGGTYIRLDNIDYAHWSDNQIKIILPSRVDTLSLPNQFNFGKPSAGSGRFYIINNNGDFKVSDSDLIIPYSILNNSIQIGTPNHKKLRYQTVSVNDSGGYTFRLDTSITNTPIIESIVRNAIKEWTCATEINFKIGSDTTLTYNPDSTDGISFIYLSNTLHGKSAIGRASSRDSRICISNGDTTLLFREIDVALTRDFDSLPGNLHWFYDISHLLNVGIDSVDMYGVLLHEFGHAHLLDHVNDTSELMYYSSRVGPLTANQRKLLTTDAISGGLNVISESSSLDLSSCNYAEIMIPYLINNCGTYSVKENIYNIDDFNLFPNPFGNDGLFIKYKVSKTSTVNFKITDITGKTLYEKDFSKKLSGDYVEEINIKNLATGLYIFIGNINNSISSKKIIKL